MTNCLRVSNSNCRRLRYRACSASARLAAVLFSTAVADATKLLGAVALNSSTDASWILSKFGVLRTQHTMVSHTAMPPATAAAQSARCCLPE